MSGWNFFVAYLEGEFCQRLAATQWGELNAQPLDRSLIQIKAITSAGVNTVHRLEIAWLGILVVFLAHSLARCSICHAKAHVAFFDVVLDATPEQD